ncbi:MAG: ATP synthase subunit I [Bacillota bacterium]
MKYIDDPDKMQWMMIKRTVYLALLPLVSSLVHDRQIFWGLAFGLLLSFLLFRLKLLNIKKAVDMSEGQASTFIRNRYFLEYALSFAGLAIAYNSPSLNVWAAAAGLFLLKVTVLGWMVIDLGHQAWKNKLDSYK